MFFKYLWTVLAVLIIPNYSFACSCGPSRTTMGFPEYYAGKLGSTATGIKYSKNGKTIFKFFSCYNRPDCKDLILDTNSMPHFYDLKSTMSPVTIFTFFNSFEEAVEYDKVTIRKPVNYFKQYFYNCYCYPKPLMSIRTVDSNESRFLMNKENPMTTHHDYKQCGKCDEIEKINSYKNEQLTLEGNFELKDNQLYFNIKSENNKRTVKIKNNFKCATALKELLGENLILSSSEKIVIKKDTIEEINLCKINISQ